MSEKLWAFGHSKGWYEVEDYLHVDKWSGVTKDFKTHLDFIGYNTEEAFYFLEDPLLGKNLCVYRKYRPNLKVPDFIVVSISIEK